MVKPRTIKVSLKNISSIRFENNELVILLHYDDQKLTDFETKSHPRLNDPDIAVIEYYHDLYEKAMDRDFKRYSV